MKNGNVRILIFLLSFLSIFAIAKPMKALRVAVILRYDDRFNTTVGAINSGIDTAKRVYEQTHPGVRIEFQRFDHGVDLGSVVVASQKVVESGIPAAIGGELSEESYVIGDTLAQKKIVFISPTATNPSLTLNKPHVFLSSFSDEQVARLLARFTLDRLKPTAIGVLHNISSPYTDFLSRRFIAEFQRTTEKSGEKVPIYEEKILRHTVDFRRQIRRFIDGKVTHVVMLSHESDFFTFFAQAAEQNFFPVYIGSDGWGSNESVFQTLVKSTAGGNRFVGYRNNYWHEDSDNPVSRRFVRAFQSAYHQKPNAWNAISFDAAWLLFTAMDGASNPDDALLIQKQLRAIKNLPLVTSSRFSFDADNTPRKDLYIYKISESGIQYEAMLK